MTGHNCPKCSKWTKNKNIRVYVEGDSLYIHKRKGALVIDSCSVLPLRREVKHG